MRIVFEFEDTGERLIYDCGWSTAKKLLDLIWDELTIKTFNKNINKRRK